jgi:hypothetical protein
LIHGYCIVLIAIYPHHSGAVFSGVHNSVGIVTAAENKIEDDQNNYYYEDDPPNG